MLGALRGATKGERFDPTAAVFPQINVEKLAKDLDLIRKGRERGQTNQPSPDVDGLDSVEHEIVSAVDEHRIRGLDNFLQHQKVYGDRLSRAAESRVVIETIAGTAEGELQAVVANWGNHLSNERAHLIAAAGELKQFQKKHRVAGVAHDRARWPSFIALGFVLLVFESLGNAFFFREASPQGLLGGFTIAVAISVMNVAFASFGGFAARYLIHVSWFLKLLALITTAACAGVVGCVNLVAAHYREAAAEGRDLDAAGIAGLDRFLANPLGLTEVMSLLLVGVGLIIAAVAFFKAYWIDHPYPDFGRVWRQMIRSRNHYAEELSAAIAEIEAARDNAVEGLREESEQARERINEALDALSGRNTLRGQLRPFLEQCDQRASRLLSIYRDANRAARTEPAPAHFANGHSFERFSPEEPDKDQIETARIEQKEIQEIVARATTRIFAAAKAAIESYPSVDALEGRIEAEAGAVDASSAEADTVVPPGVADLKSRRKVS